MRNVTIFLGVMIMLVGGATCYASFEGRPSKLLLMVSFMVAMGGLNVFVRGLVMRRSPLEATGGASPEAARYDPRPQIAGRPCARCGEKIAVLLQGYACDVCAKPCHYDCRARHELTDHAGQDPSVYR